MKMNKKKLAVVSLVLCIAAIISMGSLAWFTADDYVDNTLKFVTNFEMDLIEHQDSADGKVIGKGDNHTGITFKDVKPGSELYKDPTVVNKSKKEDQWIKFTVTVDNATAWASVVPTGTDLTTIFTGYDDSLWLHPEDPKVDGTNYVATFYLKDKLAAGSSQALFTGVTIPETMTLTQAQAIGESHIIVKAEAIQADAGSDVLTAFGVSSAS